MKLVPLTQGKFAKVDDEDFVRVSQFKWAADETRSKLGLWYAVRIDYSSGTRKNIRLHNFIMGMLKIDHKNGDGLDCQKHNLRPATQRQNLQNARKRENTTSRFKGVSKHTSCNRWAAWINIEGRGVYLGIYKLEEDAAIAYNGAAKLFFGEFARLNQV